MTYERRSRICRYLGRRGGDRFGLGADGSRHGCSCPSVRQCDQRTRPSLVKCVSADRGCGASVLRVRFGDV